MEEAVQSPRSRITLEQKLRCDSRLWTSAFRVRSRMTSHFGISDLRQIWSRPIEQTGGIAPLLRGSAIEERPKMAQI